MLDFTLYLNKHLEFLSSMFKIKLCKTKSAIIVKPVKNLKLDLAKINDRFNVVAQTSIASVLRFDNGKAVVHRYGDIF